MRVTILLPIYLLIAIAPLALSWLQGLPPRSFWDEIATGMAMTSFSILMVEFVLSGRFRAVSGRIGMDVTMRFHQLVSGTVLVFALLHPFLYRAPFLNHPLPWDPTGQLTLGLDIGSILTGVAAWIAIPVFILISIYRDQLPYRYETWRAIHAIGAVAIAALITHHAFAAGRYSADPLLAGFWVVLLAAAAASVVWTYLVKPLSEAGRQYEVTSVRKIALKTWEIVLRPRRGDALSFDAGQFAWLNIGHSPFSLYENPFSFSSAPAERPCIRFVIKEFGDMTQRIGDVQPGTTAYLDGAHGNLTLTARKGAGIALIAGGVGIAPMLSIARQHDADKDTRPLILLYGNRTEEQIVYADELSELDRRAGAQVVHVISEPTDRWRGLVGQIDSETVRRTFSFDGAEAWLYLVCGPPAMLDTVENTLLALGVPADQIVIEQFYY
ncbi:MAG: ferredoxin reductase family protein [Alphaproteobacteria bacterium]